MFLDPKVSIISELRWFRWMKFFKSLLLEAEKEKRELKIFQDKLKKAQGPQSYWLLLLL